MMAAPQRRALARLGRTGACAAALCCALSACTASLDFDRARRLFQRPHAPELPVLRSGTGTANLPRPERLRAASGELREVPLTWDPVLVGDVGGYLIERAPHRDGLFERLSPVAGGLTTTYLDPIETGPERPAVELPPDDALDAASGEAEGTGVSMTAQGDTIAATEVAREEEPDLVGAGKPAAVVTAAPEELRDSPDATAEPPRIGVPATDENPSDAAASVRFLGPDGATYYYRVRAFTPAGELSKQISEVVAATTAPLPDPPADLRAYSHQPRRVPLSWRASPDVTVSGYRIDRSPTSLGPFEGIAELNGRHTTTFIDRGLGDLRVFYYRVTAVNAAGGVGAPAEPVRAVTKPDPLPPIGLRVMAQELGANRLGWELNVEPDVTEYQLLRLRDGAEAPEVVTTIPQGTTDTVDRAVGAHEQVTYWLLAFDRDGLKSAASDLIEVTSEGYNLRATPGPDGVRLEWEPRRDEGFRGARVFRSGIISQREFSPISGSSFVDADVTPGRTYRYSVSLLNANGRSAPRSQTIEVQVPED
jgi:fibronectin type 3 domain-containing protein